MEKQRDDIVLEEVMVSYGKQLVFQNLNHRFPKNGIVCIVGASGCGKSTLLRLICGLVKPQQGKVIGTEGKRISVLFQENRLLPWINACDNVKIVCDNEDKIHQLFEKMDLLEAEKNYINTMSGGMKRRVAMIRALAYDGDIFLMDEPFQGIDEIRKKKIMEYLKVCMREKCCIIVTHDREEAFFLTNQVYQLDGSQLISIRNRAKK